MFRAVSQELVESLRCLGDGDAECERRLVQMRVISRRVAQLPERDPRPADEIIGYDESGLPS